MDIVEFNVGGVRYQTLRSTIKSNATSNLADDDFLARHHCERTDEYFFDRDPDVFKAVLNYLRTGDLHLPSFICGPAVKTELEFWGVEPNKIERCCWAKYNDWNATCEALEQFEHDRKRNISVAQELERNRGNRWMHWRLNVWQIISGNNSSLSAKIAHIFSLCFVLLSIVTFIAETTPQFYRTEQRVLNNTVNASQIATNVSFSHVYSNDGTASTLSNVTAEVNGTEFNTTGLSSKDQIIEVRVKHPVLSVFDVVCLVFFTLEYLARLVFAPRKLKYVTSLLAVIDLLAILPDYIELIVYAIKPEMQLYSSTAVDIMFTLRVARILRIFRLIRHVPGLWILVYTLRASLSELMLLVWFMTLGMLLFSSLIYFTEDREHFKTIPDGFWWALITMTTVGYGDMYPHTYPGKVVGSFCAMAGVLMIGFTVPALVNNFMLYYRHVQFALHAEESKGESKNANRNPVSGGVSCDRPVNGSSENGKNRTVHECFPLVGVNLEQ